MKNIFKIFIILCLLVISSCSYQDEKNLENLYYTRYIDEISNMNIVSTIGTDKTGINNLFSIEELNVENDKLDLEGIKLTNENLIAFNQNHDIFYYSAGEDDYTSITIVSNNDTKVVNLDDFENLEGISIIGDKLHCIFTKDNIIYKVIIYVDKKPETFKLCNYSNLQVTNHDKGFLINIVNKDPIVDEVILLENTLNFIENDYFEFLERFQDNKLLLSKGLINGNEIIDAYYIINANILENTLSFQLSSDNSLIYNSFLLDIDNNSYYLYSDKSYFIIGMIDDFIISLEEIDKERHLKYIDFINNETFIIPGYELINEIINYETINSNMIVFETEDFYDVINLKERVVRRVITEDGQIFCDEDGIYLKQKNYLYKIDL